MNLLENQIPTQVSSDFDFLSFNQITHDTAALELPNALETPRQSVVPERQGMINVYRNYLGLQPFEVRSGYEPSVPRISVRIADAVESSRRILELPENWDEEGSPAYAYQTWERAAQFVVQTAIAQRKKSGVWVDPPKITPGPDGSIDVRWKVPYRSALINFPAAETEPIQFFGSDGEIESIRGTLDLSTPNQWILMWLMR